MADSWWMQVVELGGISAVKAGFTPIFGLILGEFCGEFYADAARALLINISAKVVWRTYIRGYNPLLTTTYSAFAQLASS